LIEVSFYVLPTLSVSHYLQLKLQPFCLPPYAKSVRLLNSILCSLVQLSCVTMIRANQADTTKSDYLVL